MIVLRLGRWSMATLGDYVYERQYLRHHWMPFCWRERRSVFVDDDAYPYVKDEAGALMLIESYSSLDWGITIRRNCRDEPSERWQVAMGEWRPAKRRQNRKRFVASGQSLHEAVNQVARYVEDYREREEVKNES